MLAQVTSGPEGDQHFALWHPVNRPAGPKPLDVGVIRDAHSQGEQIDRIVHDLRRVYPDADPSLVEHVSFADLQPSVLYLSEQPAIALNAGYWTGQSAGPSLNKLFLPVVVR